MFRMFDFASPDVSMPQRPMTTVPQQALFAMNSPFALEQARHLAARVESPAGEPAAKVRGYLWGLRDAEPDEVRVGHGVRRPSRPGSGPRCGHGARHSCRPIRDPLSPWEQFSQAGCSWRTNSCSWIEDENVSRRSKNFGPGRDAGCENVAPLGLGLGILGLAGLVEGEGALAPSAAGGDVSPMVAKCRHSGRQAGDSLFLPTAGRRTSTRSIPSRRWRNTPASRCRTRTSAPNAKPARRFPRRSSSKSTESGIEVSELFAKSPSASTTWRDPLDARRRAEPRAVADADELRRIAADPPELWLLDHLRPGHRKPEPARLHRHVSRRLSDQGAAELAVGVSARRLQGTYINTQHTEVEKLVENIRNAAVSRERPAPAARPAATAESTAPAAPADDAQLEARIQSFELAYRMQMEASRRLRCLARAAIHSRHVWRRRASPADADCPATDRARRPFRAGLARCGPAVGQPRRHRGQPSQAGRANATRPSPRCLTDLKQRGMLDETLVMWGGEFGRTPTVELPQPARTRAR